MGHPSPRYIVIYQKGTYLPIFYTLDERTKEVPWGDTWKIRILGQDKSLEAGKDLLTLIKSPLYFPTNLEEVEKDTLGYNLNREDMTKL